MGTFGEIQEGTKFLLGFAQITELIYKPKTCSRGDHTTLRRKGLGCVQDGERGVSVLAKVPDIFMRVGRPSWPLQHDLFYPGLHPLAHCHHCEATGPMTKVQLFQVKKPLALWKR